MSAELKLTQLPCCVSNLASGFLFLVSAGTLGYRKRLLSLEGHLIKLRATAA